MTPEMQGPPPFETRCPRCRVSYPIETRRCIHCGGRTERPPQEAAPATPTSLVPGTGRPAARRPREATRGAPPPLRAPAPPARGPAPPPADQEEEDELPMRRGMTRGLSLLWVALAIAASLYRACTGEGPG